MTDQLASHAATVARVSAWTWVVGVLALLAVYVLLLENGTLLSASAAQWIHEFTHDGRHLLGVPCH